ncbi:hypothetical protein CEXT_734571 [Caerostris extrusa]|uniref:Uncharacterized protein n=1 Tax=Caerostris extrusa TaxID=172846 RepID=A0AAV4V2B5_CAEEX|nr:hypothetical protein CEXT_734571 [Caerostris extrusa]
MMRSSPMIKGLHYGEVKLNSTSSSSPNAPGAFSLLLMIPNLRFRASLFKSGKGGILSESLKNQYGSRVVIALTELRLIGIVFDVPKFNSVNDFKAKNMRNVCQILLTS